MPAWVAASAFDRFWSMAPIWRWGGISPMQMGRLLL